MVIVNECSSMALRGPALSECITTLNSPIRWSYEPFGTVLSNSAWRLPLDSYCFVFFAVRRDLWASGILPAMGRILSTFGKWCSIILIGLLALRDAHSWIGTFR